MKPMIDEMLVHEVVSRLRNVRTHNREDLPRHTSSLQK